MSTTQVMIMAGGTGGHVFPALAVAEALRREGYKVAWLGTGRGIENDVVPKADIHLHRLSVKGVRGKGPLAKLMAPGRLLLALAQALRILRRTRPAVVLGMGGFASGPGGIAARILGIPLVIHEQNAVAGTTNRWLAKFATRVLCGFSDVFPAEQSPVVVGNPLRSGVTSMPEPEQRGVGSHQPLRLLVLGGSQGAMAINEIMPAALALLPETDRPTVRHQAGRAHAQTAETAYQKADVQADVVPFIDDMAAALGWADLVVARAGALTVSELAAVGVGSILVPFPFAIDDHQARNADKLVRVHAARVLAQFELSKQSLAAVLGQTLQPATLRQMALAARTVGQRDATQQVTDVLVAIIEERS